ncbi:MAG: T9SS type B sorting domain-containing protein [Lutibacter sp.]|uniref:T9SS type B sorting domain-containing protein n=1 Tax=Lutibacter sp. TaxID=1925666 RepID=UPI00299F23E4|nr:T9SS type B sorting domain-containing protein [Lutibacter sp.]MDX1829751.1 T9SS type B sorting domain-containing protein [Lutibacter sp.]
MKYSLLLVSFFNFLLFAIYSYSQTTTSPTITATGNQNYCPLSDTNIVTDFDITPGSEQINTVYIQISENYSNGEDTLLLTNVASHPNISASWSSSEGKLKLEVINSTTTTYNDLIAAVKDVIFNSTNATISGEKQFSFTLDESNYLPSTGHYYEYVSDIGITWTSAKAAAASKTHYGLKGYLATITSADEAQLTGKQTTGTGWIGGSDAENEGTWKWMTGPEAGKTFWFGASNGSTTGTDIPFANWNTGEPNNLGDEDYAHITAPNVGIIGSWNDLKNTGDSGGDYQPKGYIVEYGGMPGDPTLNISASTKITVSSIISTTDAENCGAGSVTLKASASEGDVIWFDSPTNASSIFMGTSFNTPVLTATTTYYVLASVNGCTEGERKPIVATIHNIPTITSTTNDTICDAGIATLKATASEGIISWYNSLTSTESISTGSIFETPFISESTTYYVDALSNGCSSPNRTPVKATVQYTKTPINLNLSLNDFEIIDNSNNNSITIKNISNFGNGNYTFSIDNIEGPYQEYNTFENLLPGFHTIYILDNTMCGYDQIEIPILGFPKHFTPNNDGVNDTWQLQGFSTDFYPVSKIFIFNRFGKLLKELDPSDNKGWDGIFNGKRLPSSDYWFTVKLTNSIGVIKNYSGHFSLLRQ